MESITILMKGNADPNAVDSSGKSALDLAIPEQEKLQYIKDLLEGKADIKVDEDGQVVLSDEEVMLIALLTGKTEDEVRAAVTPPEVCNMHSIHYM